MQPVRSVYEVTMMIKGLIQESELLAGIAVAGEVSNLSRPSSGHVYFTLKDDRARLRVVMFSSRARFLRFLMRDGMRVVVRGSFDVFERSGDYQMYAESVEPDGLGALYLAFEQLKEKLGAEGLFDAARKRLIPKYPDRIALITSPTGAAVRDMITTLRRRYPRGVIYVVPVPVQGEDAPRQIAEAIRRVSTGAMADVAIVGRGGGSFEELFAFNTEEVARAIADAVIPIISAVGHETDTTIADFVADLRAPTPTAGAELVSADVRDTDAQFLFYKHRMELAMRQILARKTDAWRRLQTSRALQEPGRIIEERAEVLDRLQMRLQGALRDRVATHLRRFQTLEVRLLRREPSARLAAMSTRTAYLDERLHKAIAMQLHRREQILTGVIDRLSLLSPLGVLRRGYAVVFDQSRAHVITGIDQVQPGDSVRVELAGGWLDCQVWGMFEQEESSRGSEQGKHKPTGNRI